MCSRVHLEIPPKCQTRGPTTPVGRGRDVAGVGGGEVQEMKGSSSSITLQRGKAEGLEQSIGQWAGHFPEHQRV